MIRVSLWVSFIAFFVCNGADFRFLPVACVFFSVKHPPIWTKRPLNTLFSLALTGLSDVVFAGSFTILYLNGYILRFTERRIKSLLLGCANLSFWNTNPRRQQNRVIFQLGLLFWFATARPSFGKSAEKGVFQISAVSCCLFMILLFSSNSLVASDTQSRLVKFGPFCILRKLLNEDSLQHHSHSLASTCLFISISSLFVGL